MCTAITLQNANKECFFGRTMDFSYPLDPELYLMPKGMQWPGFNHHMFTNHYCSIGIGQDIGKVILADGVNEMGFSAAALYFPGYAHFCEADAAPAAIAAQTDIAALELVNYLLSTSHSVEHCASLLQDIRIVGTEDAITHMVAPLHWITADKDGHCMVIEQTKSGLHLWNNPIGVLSNSPGFEWHVTNLRNYGSASSGQSETSGWGDLKLPPFGQGAGSFGLPGDFTPPSRFVRTVFQKNMVPTPKNREETIIAGFHILEGVTIPKGVVVTSRGADDYTQYTAFLCNSTGEYFIKTYDNSQIVTASLPTGGMTGSQPVSLGKLNRPPVFFPMGSPS